MEVFGVLTAYRGSLRREYNEVLGRGIVLSSEATLVCGIQNTEQGKEIEARK